VTFSPLVKDKQEQWFKLHLGKKPKQNSSSSWLSS